MSMKSHIGSVVEVPLMTKPTFLMLSEYKFGLREKARLRDSGLSKWGLELRGILKGIFSDPRAFYYKRYHLKSTVRRLSVLTRSAEVQEFLWHVLYEVHSLESANDLIAACPTPWLDPFERLPAEGERVLVETTTGSETVSYLPLVLLLPGVIFISVREGHHWHLEGKGDLVVPLERIVRWRDLG